MFQIYEVYNGYYGDVILETNGKVYKVYAYINQHHHNERYFHMERNAFDYANRLLDLLKNN